MREVEHEVIKLFLEKNQVNFIKRHHVQQQVDRTFKVIQQPFFFITAVAFANLSPGFPTLGFAQGLKVV